MVKYVILNRWVIFLILVPQIDRYYDLRARNLVI